MRDLKDLVCPKSGEFFVRLSDGHRTMGILATLVTLGDTSGKLIMSPNRETVEATMRHVTPIDIGNARNNSNQYPNTGAVATLI